MDKVRIRSQKYMDKVAESLYRRWDTSLSSDSAHRVLYMGYDGHSYTVIASDGGHVVAIGYNDSWTFSEAIVQ